MKKNNLIFPVIMFVTFVMITIAFVGFSIEGFIDGKKIIYGIGAITSFFSAMSFLAVMITEDIKKFIIEREKEG